MLDLFVYCLSQRCFNTSTLAMLSSNLNGKLRQFRTRLPNTRR